MSYNLNNINMKTELTVNDLKMIWMHFALLNAKQKREGGYKTKEHEELENKVFKVMLETQQQTKQT